MNASRRHLIQSLAAGGAAFAATQVPRTALADSTVAQAPAAPSPPPVDLGEASSQERELKIVNVEELEDGARKILSPGRFAVMGYSGDGWTYRSRNRRAFGLIFRIMPRRLAVA